MSDKINVEGTLLDLHAEVSVLSELVAALIATHPNANQVLDRFQNQVDDRLRNVPADIDPAQVLEFRTHAVQQMLAYGRRFVPGEPR